MAVSTDTQLRTRTHLADEALAAVNVQRARRSATAATFDEFRDEAYRQILVDLRGREPPILPEMITRPADLIAAECALTLLLLLTAARSKPDDVFGLAAESWRAEYAAAIAKASPIYGVRGQGRSFVWSRA